MQYGYSGAASANQGNLNGTFTFGRSNVPFDAANPGTYPDRFSIRVGGASRIYEKVHYGALFAQDKWRMNDHLTLSLGLRYDLEVVPIPETDDPLVSSYPVDKNNIGPRVGLTYDIDGTSVVRGGYGRFFEKSHLEVIGALFTGTPFTSSFTAAFPVDGPDLGPRNGERPTDPFLVNGPVIDRALLAQLYPGGQLLRNTGATWDNADRRSPYVDEISIGYERQLGADLAASIDYVHSWGRDLLMRLNLNPTVRSNPDVASSTLTRQGSPALTEAVAALEATYPGFEPFTTSVNQFVNIGETEGDSVMLQLKKRFSRGFSAQVSYTYGDARGNTSGSGAPLSNFQVGQDLNLDRNQGPSDFDIRHNLSISGTALVPRTGGLNVSWVARALSGRPFSLTNADVDPDLNGIQAEPLPAGSYAGEGPNAFAVDGYESTRNGARGPGFFELDMRLGYRFGLSNDRRIEVFVDLFNLTDRTNFDTPTGNLASSEFLLLTGYDTSYTPRKVQIGARIQF